MAGKLNQHLRMHWAYVKTSIKTAFEYRINFIIQIVSMALNDSMWILFWLIFFSKFQELNGWGMHDLMLLYSVLLIGFGASGILFGNRIEISKMIVEGRMDYYLTLPKNVLYHTLISRTGWYDAGDLIFGLVIASFTIPLYKWPLLLVLSTTSMIIFTAFAVLVGSISFFIPTTGQAGRQIFWSAVSLSMYPSSIFKGAAKVFIMIIIPSGFITGVPVELLNNFNWTWFLITIGFTIAFSTLAVIVFYAGLRKYESGNLLYVRD